MNIKLKARLSAYSIVDECDHDDSDHVCPSVEPVTKEQIDQLFTNSETDTDYSSRKFKSFVDSLFTRSATTDV